MPVHGGFHDDDGDDEDEDKTLLGLDCSFLETIPVPEG